MTTTTSSGAFIDPPPRPSPLLRLLTWLAERIAGRRLLLARLLAWYPRAALGAGALEATIAHDEGRAGRRMLKLVRLAASFATACPLCVGMNTSRHREAGVTDEELEALRTAAALAGVASFSGAERLAIAYARTVSESPPRIPPALVAELRRTFTERELVVLATTAAQVNYWGRLAEALGVPS